MRYLFLAAMLVGCGGGDAGPDASPDAWACAEALHCEDTSTEGPVDPSFLGEWTLVGDVQPPTPPAFDAGLACLGTITVKVCIRDETTAEVMYNGARTTTTAGTRMGLGVPNLGLVRIGGAQICSIYIQQGVDVRFEDCSCGDIFYNWGAVSHDSPDCPSFP